MDNLIDASLEEKEFPEGVNVLIDSNHKLTVEQKNKLVDIVNEVFFNGNYESDDISEL